MKRNSSPHNTQLILRGCGYLILTLAILMGVFLLLLGVTSGSPLIAVASVFLVVGPIVLAVWMHNSHQEERQWELELHMEEFQMQLDKLDKEEERERRLQEGLEEGLESLGASGGLEGVSGWEFEGIMAELFKKLGYTVSVTKGSGDEGIDLFLEKEGLRTGVQCKRWKTMIGQRVIREFYGSLIHANLKKGFVITTNRFSEAAKDFAEDKPIVLIDREELRRMILEDLSEPLSPTVKDVSPNVSLEREETAGRNIGTNPCTSCWLSGDCDTERRAVKKREVISNCRGYFVKSE